MGKTCERLLKENANCRLSEVFQMDLNNCFSELVGRKLVLIVNPELIEENARGVGYQVKSSDDPSLIKLFELAEKSAIKNKLYYGSSSNQVVASGSILSSVIVRIKNSVSGSSTQEFVSN